MQELTWMIYSYFQVSIADRQIEINERFNKKIF